MSPARPDRGPGRLGSFDQAFVGLENPTGQIEVGGGAEHEHAVAEEIVDGQAGGSQVVADPGGDRVHMKQRWSCGDRPGYTTG